MIGHMLLCKLVWGACALRDQTENCNTMRSSFVSEAGCRQTYASVWTVKHRAGEKAQRDRGLPKSLVCACLLRRPCEADGQPDTPVPFDWVHHDDCGHVNVAT